MIKITKKINIGINTNILNTNSLTAIALESSSLSFFLSKKLFSIVVNIFEILPPVLFKIIKDVSVGDIVAVIATDELIKDDWIDKANDYIAELNRGL